MGSWEWPLILFTVLGQVAVGMLLVLWWLNRDSLPEQLLKRGVLVSGIFLIAALLASLFHLGHPEAAYRAIMHLGSSWLSREIFLFMLTFAGWLYLFWGSCLSAGKSRMPLLVTSFLGLLGIISSAMIYVLPRVPAWDNVTPVFSFLMSAGLLGALVILVLGDKGLEQGQKKSLLQWSIGCIVLSVLGFVLYASSIHMTPEGAATVQYLLTSPLFWVRVLMGWLAPLVFLIWGLKAKQGFSANLLYVAVAFVGIGEVLGRALFYLSAVGIHITALF